MHPTVRIDHTGFGIVTHPCRAHVVRWRRPMPTSRHTSRSGPMAPSPFTYTSRTHADADGRYLIRLPYPTERYSPSVDVGAHYRFESAGVKGELVVREVDVKSGSVVIGPTLLP